MRSLRSQVERHFDGPRVAPEVATQIAVIPDADAEPLGPHERHPRPDRKPVACTARRRTGKGDAAEHRGQRDRPVGIGMDPTELQHRRETARRGMEDSPALNPDLVAERIHIQFRDLEIGGPCLALLISRIVEMNLADRRERRDRCIRR